MVRVVTSEQLMMAARYASSQAAWPDTLYMTNGAVTDNVSSFSSLERRSSAASFESTDMGLCSGSSADLSDTSPSTPIDDLCCRTYQRSSQWTLPMTPLAKTHARRQGTFPLSPLSQDSIGDVTSPFDEFAQDSWVLQESAQPMASHTHFVNGVNGALAGSQLCFPSRPQPIAASAKYALNSSSEPAVSPFHAGNEIYANRYGGDFIYQCGATGMHHGTDLVNHLWPSPASHELASPVSIGESSMMGNSKDLKGFLEPCSLDITVNMMMPKDELLGEFHTTHAPEPEEIPVRTRSREVKSAGRRRGGLKKERKTVYVPAWTTEPVDLKTEPAKPHKCQSCMKAFERKEHLGRHFLTHDKANKPFQCAIARIMGEEVCKKDVNRQDNRVQHYITHITQKRNNYVPPEQVFYCIRELERIHQQEHGKPECTTSAEKQINAIKKTLAKLDVKPGSCTKKASSKGSRMRCEGETRSNLMAQSSC